MSQVSVFTTSTAPAGALERVRRLVDESFDGDFSDADWDHALGGWHVLVTEGGNAIAHAAVVPRTIEFGQRPFHAGYMEAVVTAPSNQRAGIGSMVTTEAVTVVRREFDVGVLSTDRHSFYERLGWERWCGPTFVHRDGQRVRTQDEDDGIMVLRFGPSIDVELTDRIVCESRSGDDW